VKLLVRVVCANDLPKMDMTGSTDGYVKVLLGENKDTQQKTSTVSKSLDPEWNENFAFAIGSDSSEILNFRLFDKETFSKDDFIGLASISVQDIITRGPQTKQFSLIDKKDNIVKGKSGVDTSLTVELGWTADV